MIKSPLFGVFSYADVDRAFWDKHLENWLPKRIIDAHFHFVDPELFQIETVTDEMARSYWVAEVCQMPTSLEADRAIRMTFPGRDVRCVAFGHVTLGFEIEGSNEYVRSECAKRAWHSLAVVRPTWVAEQVEWWLKKRSVIGAKPYYGLIGYSRDLRNSYIEASIFDYLPHHQLEVLDDYSAWLTLHVPKVERLADPDNIREIREIRRRYPHVKLIIAHLGRCYTEIHAKKGLLPLADDPGIYFDTSAVLNPAVHLLALKHIGPARLLYGTDCPVMYLRGRRQFRDREYINRTNLPFHFNKDREPAEIEAKYTLYMYEELKAIKDACENLGLGRDQVTDIFFGNAERLILDVVAGRKRKVLHVG